MRKIFILMFIIIFIVTSCASNENAVNPKLKTKSIAKRDVSSSEDDFSWVEQLDFDKKTEEKYKAEKDGFDFSSKETTENVLLQESLVHLNPAKLEETLGKTNDSLVKINVKCYQGKFEDAFKIADSEYEKFKNNTSYWNQLGTCYFLKNDYAKAILFYNKSRDLDSKFIPPVNNLGVVYQKQGKFQKALAAFKLASDLNNFSITPTYNLAQLYLKFGTVSKALPIFQGLYKKSPNDQNVAGALASSLLIKGDFQAAADLYSKFSKSTLADPSIGLNYALTLKYLNRPKDALTVFSNVTSVKDLLTGPLGEYAAKIENFIRN